ncbi:hypothetical protein BVRB_6g154020 [Beta vulgaris subsp. vulgaris]|nr:hypothetical protein BVRB_6g154020 [Beta vulgaris subsp. vulgaris]
MDMGRVHLSSFIKHFVICLVCDVCSIKLNPTTCNVCSPNDGKTFTSQFFF